MSAKIFIAFVIVSISSMFPNNAFMNAHEYFYYKLRNVTSDTNLTSDASLTEWPNNFFRVFQNTVSNETPTRMQADFEAYLTVYGGVACVLGSFLNVFATKSLSNSFRVIVGHFLVIIMFVPTIFLTFVDFDEDQEAFFNISMGLISVACFGSLGMMAGGVLGLSAQFPSKYTQAVMIGQSAAGVLAAVMSILCQTVTSNVILNGQMYFTFSLFMAFLSLAIYFYLVKLAPAPEVPDEDRERLLNEEVENEDNIIEDFSDVHIENQASHFPPIDASSDSDSSEESMWIPYLDVIKKSSTDLITISVVLLVTLAAYPGLTSLVRSTSRNHTWNSYFSAVASFLLYNVGDLIGRSTANSLRMPRRWLLVISCLRFLLIPMIAMCNVAPRSHTKVMLPYDGIFVLLVIILSTSHGFCITNATIGATLSIEKESRELAGSIVSLIGVTAAMIGGVMGVLVIKLI